jgi:hypothetical protein
MLLRSRKLVDLIILSQENREHPLPRKIVDRGANHTYSTTTNFYFIFNIKDTNLAQLSHGNGARKLIGGPSTKQNNSQAYGCQLYSFHLRVFLGLSNPQG